MSRGQLHLALSFLVNDNIYFFLLIFFSISVTRSRNHDFVLLLFGTQKQSNTTLYSGLLKISLTTLIWCKQ